VPAPASPPPPPPPPPPRARRRAAAAAIATAAPPPPPPPADRARAEAALVAAGRLGLRAPPGEAAAYARFPAATALLRYPFEQVLAAQASALGAPGDPLAPLVRAVATLSQHAAGAGGEVRRARRIDVAVPAAFRWLLAGVDAVELREELLALPAARWARVATRNASCAALGALLDQSVFEAAPGSGGAATRWTALFDLHALGWGGAVALRFVRAQGLPELAALLMRKRLASLEARLLALYGAPAA